MADQNTATNNLLTDEQLLTIVAAIIYSAALDYGINNAVVDALKLVAEVKELKP